MAKIYRAALIGCSRMGAFIDNERKRAYAFSHAACYEASPRTELVACTDLRADVLDRAGERYGVPREHRYLDHREMLAAEQPDIVSIATQPEQRTEIVLQVIEAGVKAIYAEKAMAASMAETEAVVSAVRDAGVAFNLGTNRRWDPRYDRMAEIANSGDYGELHSILFHAMHGLFNMGSHAFDLMLKLNRDATAVRVQGRLDEEEDLFDGDVMVRDPRGHGIVDFANGVTGYGLNTGAGWTMEAVCEGAVIQGEPAWQIRTGGEVTPIPGAETVSSGVTLVDELARSLDTGEPPERGGVGVARAGNELIFALVESHRRSGVAVELPLTGSSARLSRPFQPRQPRFEPSE